MTPARFALIVNSVEGTASVQLSVSGQLIDGSQIDLTSQQRGTTYSSSNLDSCNFGNESGKVFASSPGVCTISVANNGFTTQAEGSVSTFTPSALSFVDIPGFGNGLSFYRGYAFIAAGSGGLQVVDPGQDRTTPTIVGALSLPGNANDIAIENDVAFVAAGASGLHAIDISNPRAPRLIRSLALEGNALSLKVRDNSVFIGSNANLHIIDVTNPSALILTSSLSLGSGSIWDIELDTQRALLAVALGGDGVSFVDIGNVAAPAVRVSYVEEEVRSVSLRGNYAIIGGQDGTRSIDISTLSNPQLASQVSLELGGILNDIALSGNFAIGADIYFVNGVPILNIEDPGNISPRAILSFPGNGNGMAVALDDAYVYLLADAAQSNRGRTSGNSKLYVGQYRSREDRAGVSPEVSITAPLEGSIHFEGAQLTVTANALDDVAVQNVSFLVNDEVVFTTSSTPYRYTFTVPNRVNSLKLGVRATDLGGNIGVGEAVTVQVVPDPLTLVTGQVFNEDGTAAVGATVTTAGGRSSVTGNEGRYEIGGVPTVLGAISVVASLSSSGGEVTGVSQSTLPVRGGVTSVGSIILVPAQFERSLGTFISNQDDTFYSRSLPFSFRFFGQDYTQIFVGTNGYITFGAGDNNYVETLPDFSSLPRISAFFDDLYGAVGESGAGVFINDQIPGKFIITHDRVGHFDLYGSNTIQIQLFQDGRIVFVYDGITALDTGTIVGITPGPQAPLEQINLSDTSNYEAPVGSGLYEYFTGANTFDIDRSFVLFTPRSDGGYGVRVLTAPPIAQSSLISSQTAVPVLGLRARSFARSSSSLDTANAEVHIRSSSNPDYQGMTNTDSQGEFSLNGVPGGGISVVIEKEGRIVGVGGGVVDTEDLSAANTLEIKVSAPNQEAK